MFTCCTIVRIGEDSLGEPPRIPAERGCWLPGTAAVDKTKCHSAPFDPTWLQCHTMQQPSGCVARNRMFYCSRVPTIGYYRSICQVKSSTPRVAVGLRRSRVTLSWVGIVVAGIRTLPSVAGSPAMMVGVRL